jgi:hypothetical protein
MRRAAAVVLAALVTMAGLLQTARPAAAAGSAQPAVQLLSQTPWLEGPGQYGFHVGLNGFAPSDHLEVTVFDQMRTRSGFQQAAVGHIDDRYFYQVRPAISGLPPDGQGGFAVELHVNQAPPPGSPFPQTVPIGETGVFPVQLTVLDANGNPVGQSLVTFIVYVLQTQSAGEITPLTAGVVIPVWTAPSLGPGGTVGTPSTAEVSRLSQLASVLNGDSSVHASLLASPLTLAELSNGKTVNGQKAVTTLSSAARDGPFEILPSTYSPVSLGDLTQAGLASEIQWQLDTGAATLRSVFGVGPEAGTWVVNGPLDSSTLNALMAQHAAQLIVPNSDLTALSSEVQITFGRATHLTSNGSTVQVMAADAGLTSDFTRSSSPILAANQLLAELAMIYTEAPNAIQARAVAVLPPPGWSVSPAFVQTLLTGLQGNPLVSATTASALFSAAGAPQSSRALSSPNPAQSTAAQNLSLDADRIQRARAQIAELGRMFPSPANQASEVDILDRRLLLAETSSFTDAQRQSVLAGISDATSRVKKAVALPPDTSITLTSSKAEIPLTILTLGDLHPKVQLRLTSSRLIFRPFNPPNGDCAVVTDVTEICTLTLTTQNTTLKVPVETRSSGVFPLEVALFAPDTPLSDTTSLASSQDTLRSTAVSGVALIVIGVALFALVLWWGRDLRRGRRPKQMVPAPGVEVEPGPPGTTGTTGTNGNGSVERPPPDPDGRGMSPSVSLTGPSSAKDPQRRGNEWPASE